MTYLRHYHYHHILGRKAIDELEVGGVDWERKKWVICVSIKLNGGNIILFLSE
jgi:hypothetical protein